MMQKALARIYLVLIAFLIQFSSFAQSSLVDSVINVKLLDSLVRFLASDSMNIQWR